MIDEKDVARALQRPGALPPFLTSLGIFVALVVLGFLGATLSALSVTTRADYPAEFFLQIWASQLVWGLAGPLPIALGAFVCFWQIAPIAPNLRLAHVVTRAVLAGLAGTLLLFLLGLLFGVLLWVLSLGGLLRAGEIFGSGGGGIGVLPLLFQSLATFLQVLPVLVLGAVLLWGWLQRHPPTKRLAGTLDEV
ncbi:hypothetical protein [Pseudolysinimonas sp.]|uniref:hypothetical protein n=1 Tax=Pseudolysinimonas sp. TaxID=2680009 RepID=UPI003784C846